MAQMHHVHAEGGRSGAGLGVAHFIGAVASLALTIGVGVWGYQMVTRDVSGVPVVRAAEGPMRVAPEKPGGLQADHQGLAVNNVAAEGTAAKPADRIILAPAPLDLSEEDVVVKPQEASLSEQEADADTPSSEQIAQPVSADAEETLDPLQLAVVEALALRLSDGVDQISTDEVQTSSDAATVTPAVVKGGLGRSLRPQVRPAHLDRSAPSNVELTSSVAAIDVDPATIPVGTRLAQLGAFASPEIARVEWDKLTDRFGDYMEGKGRVVQKASSGGRTFYRLRATGFEDLSDARRFCSALVAERADCIPVVTR